MKPTRLIVSASRSYSEKDRLLILTTGSTTDVASALLEDPTLPERVEILTMGFNSWPQGTDPWNIKNDPLAYKVILDSDAPITIGSGDDEMRVCRYYSEGRTDSCRASRRQKSRLKVGSRRTKNEFASVAQYAVGQKCVAR